MPLAACKECRKEVSTRAKTCPHCGVSEPVPNVFPKLVKWGIVALVLGLVANECSGNSAEIDRARREAEQYGRPIDARVVCEEAVKGQLKAPSTAGLKSSVTSGGGGKYVVVGTFDAQNSFGAMLRGTYTCGVTFEAGTGNYKFTNFRVQ